MTSKQFLSVPYDILGIQGLTPTEKLVLARIAGFEEYFESTAKCADFLKVKPDTVKKAKCHLEQLGYITATEDTGRGKKYCANHIWAEKKTEIKPEPKPMAEEEPTTQEPFDPSSLGIQSSSTDQEERPKRIKFSVRYAAYMQSYDRGLMYLRKHHIGVSNSKRLEGDFAALVETLKPDLNDKEINYTFSSYFQYLESNVYLYQLEHNKYCPQINTQNDLYTKFNAIRNFKNSPERQYDPSKVLTT